jgi:diguanylate cyclase (GGDEF)-like protein/PAS domain S-box-containing protein
MKPAERAKESVATDELSALIASLHETEQRIDLLTRGQIDSVASSDGHTYLLRHAQAQLREDAAAKNAHILDALPAHVALLDVDGVIVAVNAAWHDFAEANGYAAGEDGLGSNYLAVCSMAGGPGQSDAQHAAHGIHAVITGTRASFALEYPCHSPLQNRWFELRVTPIEGGRPGGVVVMHVNITSRRIAEGESEELQKQFADLLMNMDLASVMLDLEGRITFCNEHLLRLSGWRREEVLGADWFSTFIPPSVTLLKERFNGMLEETITPGHGEHAILTRGGDLRLVRWSNSLRRSASGEVVGPASIGEDVTEQRLAEVRLRHLSRVQRVLSGISTLIVRVTDRDSLHQGACRIAVESGGFRMAMLLLVDADQTQLSLAATAGKDPTIIKDIQQSLANPVLASASLTAQAIREREVVVSNDCTTDSRLILSETYLERGVRSLAVLPLLIAERALGVFILYSTELDFFQADELELLTELTDEIAFAMDHIDKSERLAFLSFYDPLTELPNLQLFQDQLDRYIALARQDGGCVCVVVMDLDGFTDINQRLGWAIGDELLRAVALRLRKELVEPFALGRTATDTFALACPYRTQLHADRLRDDSMGALQRPFEVGAHSIKLSAQAGIALYPDDGDEGLAVFRNAESALKRAKASKQSYVYFSHELHALAAVRLALEAELVQALLMQEFRVHYQPRIDMRSGEVVGAEALIRWQHPSRGLLGPAEFIELAEETALIIPIGNWMLQSVCRQQAAWIAAGLPVVPVAVNVSAVQFEKSDLLQVIRATLLDSALPPRLLHIELTESAVMREPTAAAVTLHAIRALGVELSLDDFGTGYSSLAHLKRYPFSAVKIDRSFVTHITSNIEDAAIATAIIAMSHQLGLRVVAEGVETQGQFNYLSARRCDEMQGYLFSRAVTVEDYEHLLRVGTRLPLPEGEDASISTLLVVDNEPDICNALTDVLSRDGYRILSASNAEQALELLAENTVQVVLVDQRMSAMAGTQLLGKIAGLHPTVVRILMSTHTELSVLTAAVNQGAVFKLVAKPWDEEQLRQQVREAFAYQRAGGQL